MKKFLNQLAVFATILGTIGIILKNSLTISENIFIIITAVNATMYFCNKIEEGENED